MERVRLSYRGPRISFRQKYASFPLDNPVVDCPAEAEEAARLTDEQARTYEESSQ